MKKSELYLCDGGKLVDPFQIFNFRFEKSDVKQEEVAKKEFDIEKFFDISLAEFKAEYI